MIRLTSARASVTSLTFVIALAGCGATSGSGSKSASGSGSSQSSSVASVAPASGATSVALNTTVQIKFATAVTSSTVNVTNIQLADSQPITGTVTYDSSSNTAIFTPSIPLGPNIEYTLKVSGVTSSTGAALAAFTSSFTTVNDNSTQYQATLFPAASGVTGSGQIIIPNCGCVAVKLTGAAVSTSYGVNFCPAYPSGNTTPPACIPVGTVQTDASGNASQELHFPQAGRWAGDFQAATGGAVQYSTTLVAPAGTGGSTQVYMATLQPLNSVNGGTLKAAGGAMPQSVLNQGTISWTNGNLQFSVTGGVPNTSYEATENIDALGGSTSYLLYDSQHQSAFTTDSNGNITFSVLQDGSTGDLFELEPQNNQAGYIGGFSIPQ